MMPPRLHLWPGVRGCRSRQGGMSLMELLVAMALGLLLVVGIGSVYLGSQQTYRMQEANARLQENGRFALEVIGRSLRQAGALGDISAATMAMPLPSTTPITGTANSLTVEFNAAMAENNGGTWGERDCTGQFANANANELIRNEFSLTASDDLQCRGSVVTPAVSSSQTEPLISGVQELQFIYGVDNDGDQSANFYTATPAGWNNVVTARVCVMLRSEEQGLAPSGQRPLDCARALGTATGQSAQRTDTHLYRSFVATFNLRNRTSNIP